MAAPWTRLATLLRPRLRTVLLAVNLVVVLLPLAGLAVLRVYETELARRAESELYAQAVSVEAVFRAAVAEALAARVEATGFRPPAPGARLPAPGQPGHGAWNAVPQPVLDLATEPIFPRLDSRESPALRPDPVARMAGARVAPVLTVMAEKGLGRVILLDPNGLVLAGLPGAAGRTVAHLVEVRAALTGRTRAVLRVHEPPDGSTGQTLTRDDTPITVAVAHPVVADGRLIGIAHLSKPPRTFWAALADRADALLVGAVVIVLVLLGLTLVAAVTVTRPVRALIQQTERAAAGEPGGTDPIAHPRTREIARLSEAVAGMARTLDSRAAYIRDFAYHVSHEFKTPIASMEGALELLRDHLGEMSAEDQRRFLDNLAGDVNRLGRLVQRLLQLARADTARAGDERTILRPILDRLLARFEESGPALVLAGDGLDATLAMSAETCESILLNLCDNSRQHGARRVTLDAFLDEGGRRLAVVLTDDGPGIPPDNAGRVFDPFFTTRRESDGTGLGLSIVRALVEGHGGGIALQPSLKGASFRVDLPTA